MGWGREGGGGRGWEGGSMRHGLWGMDAPAQRCFSFEIRSKQRQKEKSVKDWIGLY